MYTPGMGKFLSRDTWGADSVAELTGMRNLRGTMWALTFVINGIDANQPKTTSGQYALNAPFPIRIETPQENSDAFWAKFDLLPYKNTRYLTYPGVGEWSERGDWHPEYWDRTANQTYHFWFYVSASFFEGMPMAMLGNSIHDHEPYDDIIHNPPTHVGNTKQDWDLGFAGAQLGNALGQNYFSQGDCSNFVTISNVRIGSWIRTNLKDPSYRGGR
jgi:hypothetical protein